MTLVLCELPAGSEDWKPDPFPGDPAAKLQGCSCPDVQPWPGALIFETDCPVHELEEAKPS